ncbi:type I-E CRISPR-associated protein Cas7/Cse4/CasC [Falseniella ignava]|uniref:Type I-E CRISPR-associated protein Cas7/Cse4/CasC n=2 Tax=Falseniella ignava TaxID=137730 RepID=A0A2I1JYX7_9LACT|nr:type I-E CRISPR-associated protein Cas7/Cse4/CasC [Falseniella ignava]
MKIMKNRVFLDVHAIQTLPPSNINRDDTGSPKTAQYGGVRRSRVSSQSWKKAMRDYFKEYGNVSNVGVRTLNIVNYIAQKIQEIDPKISYEPAIIMADDILNKANIKTKDLKAKALFFLGDIQAQRLAEAAISQETDKKNLQAILRDNPAIDIALFGRMVADDPSLNEDASCQVAHAISTHAVDTEFDFFTAIDDLSPEDNAGAGMLGTIEFNSSTLYRYANIALHELTHQINNKEATINTVNLFLDAFVKSLPTGKVTTFANQTLPQALLVQIRSDRPINLVTAFEKPICSSKGYVDESIDKLFKESLNVSKIADEPISTYYLVLNDADYSDFGGQDSRNLDELKHLLTDKLKEILPEMSES